MPGFIDQAQQQLQLTPQERALYERHLENLYGPGKVIHPNGAISTLYQMSFTGPGGRTYNIPTVYDGKILDPDVAYQRAQQYGLQYFPSYPDQKTAEQRYQQMHNFMEQDTAQYLQSPKQFSGR